MSYPSLESCVLDLERNNHLVRIREEVDPHLEMASIHRRVFEAEGPALFFERVKGSPFPAVSNLWGTEKRWRFIFRKHLKLVEEAIKLKAQPEKFLATMLKNRLRPLGLYTKLPFVGLSSLPRRVSPKRAGVLRHKTSISQLPQIVSWPQDGGAFITLPQVLSTSVGSPSIMKSNLGMYRVQMSGNQYREDQEVGLHYQIHRGIGIHHSEALQQGRDLPVSIFVGGPPAHTLSAVMPMPEGMSELIFAGMLSGKRFSYCHVGEHVVSADADFCITGWIRGKKTKPEGPFGDHLGYYSLAHEFPYLEVTDVYHKPRAIWPFTVVGRPPQEDSSFGKMIHELTQAMVPGEVPGVKELHAVDAAGVHPLLLAIGSERYVPYRRREPLELLTQAQAVLGFNQCSLAKYLLVVAREDNESLKASCIKDYFTHVLERVDFRRDLHFHTKTTMDTLDYSSSELNKGSKLVIAACGDKKRKLAKDLSGLAHPKAWNNPKLVIPGVLVFESPAFTNYHTESVMINQSLKEIPQALEESFPLLVLVDDSDFASRSFNNFLWLTFTRSNPSCDVYGVGSHTHYKHWGCKGSLVIDARSKSHHAPSLEPDPAVEKKVDLLCKGIV